MEKTAGQEAPEARAALAGPALELPFDEQNALLLSGEATGVFVYSAAPGDKAAVPLLATALASQTEGGNL